ncbi:carbohydrate ABC transporter permease [Parablautia muri]
MKRKKKLNSRPLSSYFFEIFMLCVCVFFMIPFYYLVVNTFKTAQEATKAPMALPRTLFLENYQRAFEGMNFLNSLTNTVIITVCSVTLIIIFGSMAAYAIERRQNRVTKACFYYFLIGFMIPVQSIIIPLFLVLQTLHLQNSIWGLIVLYTSWSNFAMFMYRGFLSGVPVDLEDAARIDGGSVWKTFWLVVFPLLKPITVTIMIFDVMWIWNDFLYPFLFLSSSKKGTLVMEVYKGVGEFTSDWARMMATMVIVLIPIVIFYIAMQKHIIAGITSGAVKG